MIPDVPLSATTTAATIAQPGCPYPVGALHADGPPRSPPHESPAKSPWLRGRVATPRPECSPETGSRHDRNGDNRSSAQTSHRLAPRRAAAAHRDSDDHTTGASRTRRVAHPLDPWAAPRNAEPLCPPPPVRIRSDAATS